MNDMMSGFDEAPMQGGLGIYLLPGNYLLKIVECKNGVATQGGFSFFDVEFEIIESDCSERPKGSRVEYMVAFKNQQYKSTYLADVKRFLFNAFKGFLEGTTEEQINGQIWAQAVSTAQPLAGKYVAATAAATPQKHSPQKTFTKVNWRPWGGPGVMPGQSAAPPQPQA
jgi:hypothetical protein